MKAKTVLFIPTYHYLSDSLFSRLSSRLKGHHTIYCELHDPASWPINKKHFNKEILYNSYDKILELENVLIPSGINVLKSLRQTRKYIKAINKLLDRIQPDIIVTTGDSHLSSCFVDQWNKKNKKQLYIIQPSFLNFSPGLTFSIIETVKRLLLKVFYGLSLPRGRTLFGDQSAYPEKHLFLWGDYFKEKYKGTAIYPHITLSGNPFAENIPVKKLTPKIQDIKNKAKNRPVITICTQDIRFLYGEKFSLSLNNLYRNIISANQDLFFILKPHPRENTQKYRDILQNINSNNFHIEDKLTLDNIFTITQLQISNLSFSSFEAVIKNIPIILINPGNRIRVNDYFMNRIELRADNLSDLNTAIHEALSTGYQAVFKSKRGKYLDYMIHHKGSDLLDTVCDHINKTN